MSKTLEFEASAEHAVILAQVFCDAIGKPELANDLKEAMIKDGILSQPEANEATKTASAIKGSAAALAANVVHTTPSDLTTEVKSPNPTAVNPAVNDPNKSIT